MWGHLDGAEIALANGERIAEESARYLAPATPSKIIAVHLTYRSRVEEYAARVPPQPSYFMKPPTTLNGHRGTIQPPRRHALPELRGRARGRDRRAHEGRRPKPTRSPMSPATRARTTSACTTSATPTAARCCASRARTASCHSARSWSRAGEFDPTDFTLRTYLNGEVVQEAHASDLLFGVAYQLADLSRLITLEPGDVILTGTPANSRPMEPGDTVEVEIDGIGRLTNTVEEWDVDLSGPGDQPETSAQTLHVALAIPEEEAERMVEERTAR